jgi:dihydrofolate reductase
MKNFAIIAAADLKFGIGIKNTLPWKIPSELKYFQKITDQSTVIMGRNTWESLPLKSRPLKNRQNIVISRKSSFDLPTDVLLANSLDDALNISNRKNIFVIGGSQMYNLAIKHKNCTKVYLTQILSKFDCDTFFPGQFLQDNFTLETESKKHTENGLKYIFQTYTIN